MPNDLALADLPHATRPAREPGDSFTRKLTPPDVSAAQPIVRIRALSKEFRRGRETLKVLRNLDLTLDTGAFVALMGPSGSGKSTLLNIVAGLDEPTSGTVEIDGVIVSQLGDDARAKWRAENIGFVFQTFNLLPVLTAAQNVALPLLLAGLSARERRERARIALEAVGLVDRANHYPRELSGGQEQRVAIARAIVGDPSIIVADEPTGDLDRQSADDVLTLMETLCSQFGKTIIMVTHDPLAGQRASVLHRLDKGSIVRDTADAHRPL